MRNILIPTNLLHNFFDYDFNFGEPGVLLGLASFTTDRITFVQAVQRIVDNQPDEDVNEAYM